MTAPGDGAPQGRLQRIDLNADLGEGIGDDEALLRIVTSANIATGAHAGGGRVLARAVSAATRGGVAIGAHPSYRDRAGFGRASHLALLHTDLSARSHLVADLVAQVLGVAREADHRGAPLAHVKAHGSLYNEAVRDPVAAQVVADAVLGVQHALGYRVAVLTQPGGQLAALASRLGLTVLHEGFADRAYRGTGHLVGRGEPGAVLGDVESMLAQALALAGGHVTPIDGPPIPLAIDSLCVHGDTPGAVAAAQAIRAALEQGGWLVACPRGHAATSERAQGWLAAAEDQGPPTGGRTGVDASDTDGMVGELLTILAFGDRALLVEPADRQPPGTQWVLHVAVRARRRWPTATVVPGLASVLVAFERPSDRPDPRGREAQTLLSGDTQEGSTSYQPTPARLHALPTRYDGPDLVDVAAMLRLPAEEVVRRHREATWTVAAVGFSPGFGYLTTPDPLFAGVARRPDPRPRVPRGSVALAAGMCAVYPSATPGGWQLIATTPTALFDVHAEHPAVLRVGDRVTFLEVP